MSNDNIDLAKGGVKYDIGKLRWDLLPFDAMDEVVRVLTFGANKYADRNWEAGMRWGRPFGAAQRHQSAYAQGEDRDEETGTFHIANAICELLFLLTYQIREVGEDDRTRFSEDGKPDPEGLRTLIERIQAGKQDCAPGLYEVRNSTRVGITDREDVPVTPPNHSTPQRPETMVTWGPRGETLFHPRNPQCNPKSCITEVQFREGWTMPAFEDSHLAVMRRDGTPAMADGPTLRELQREEWAYEGRLEAAREAAAHEGEGF